MRRTSVRRHIRRTSRGPTAVVRHNRTVPQAHGKRAWNGWTCPECHMSRKKSTTKLDNKIICTSCSKEIRKLMEADEKRYAEFKIGEKVKVLKGPLGAAPIGRVIGIENGLYYVQFKGGDRMHDIPEKNLRTVTNKNISDILQYER